MKMIEYEAYVEGTDLKADFTVPEDANAFEKRYEAGSAIWRKIFNDYKDMIVQYREKKPAI